LIALCASPAGVLAMRLVLLEWETEFVLVKILEGQEQEQSHPLSGVLALERHLVKAGN